MRSASAAKTGFEVWPAWRFGRGLTFGLAAGLVLLQYPLWFGEGGWMQVQAKAERIAEREAQNARLRTRNAALAAEVADLKQGRDAVEERARHDLGMIAPGEWYVRVVDVPGRQMEKPNE